MEGYMRSRQGTKALKSLSSTGKERTYHLHEPNNPVSSSQHPSAYQPQTLNPVQAFHQQNESPLGSLDLEICDAPSRRSAWGNY
jgi:hypothetical protein